MADTIFKGCTKPVTKFGVPIAACVAVGLPCGILFLIVGFKALLAGAVLYVVLRLIASHDDQQFRLLWLHYKMRWAMKNRAITRRFWGASTYSPIVFRKRRG